MPIYEWRRLKKERGYEYTITQGSIHDPIPVPEGYGWVRMYSYQVGKVSGVGDSPSRSVKSQ